MAGWKRRSLVLVSLLCTACAANNTVSRLPPGQVPPPPPGPSLSITSSQGAVRPRVAQAAPPAAQPARTVTTSNLGSPDGDWSPPPTPRVEEQAPVAKPATTATAKLPPKDFVFRLEVGDELEIKVWQEPELTSQQRILRDGTISPSLLKPMKAVGRSIHELHEELTVAYREYINDPRVSVRMVDVYRDRVFFLGEVKSPSAHQIIGPTTLLQGIALAGGFDQEVADKATVRIVRTMRNGRSRVFTVNTDRIMRGNARRVMLEPGDIVYVHPTGLADWSRRFTQLLSPIGDLLGTAASAAAIAVAIDNN